MDSKVPLTREHMRGTRGLARSFMYAGAGIWWACRTERNMRIHLGIGALAIIFGVMLHFSAIELALISVIITLVVVLEMLNTVVEAAVDLASPEYHPLAKAAKDVAAGAVLVSACGAIVVGLLLFIPHLLTIIPR